MLTQVVTKKGFKASLLKWRRHSGCLTSHDMREISTIARSILIVAVLVTGACVRAPKREAEFEAVRAEILAIEDQWATAIERQDGAAIERFAAEDFRFLEEDGRWLNRAEYIATRSHNPDNVKSAVQDQIEVGNTAMPPSPPAARSFMGRELENHSFTAFDGRTCTCAEMADGKQSPAS